MIVKFCRVWRNRMLAILADLLSIGLAFSSAYFFRFSFDPNLQTHISSSLYFLWILLPFQFLFFIFFGLYRGVWRFASLHDLIRIIKAVSCGTLLLVLIWFLGQGNEALPRSVPILYFVFLIVFMAGSRTAYRLFKTHQDRGSGKRVLIIGAGDAGEGLIRDLLRHATQKYKPVAILDDHPSKNGRELHGVRVVGKINALAQLAEKYRIEHVFVAIPSLSAKDMRRIVDLCHKVALPFSTLPSLQELSSSQVNLGHLRDVSLEDLIGREEVHVDISKVAALIDSKVVLVTGGGGSIGSELCRQISHYGPQKLIVLDHAEFNLYEIDAMLKTLPNLPHYEVCLGSVTDPIFMKKIFKKYQPKLVFHAAAYKHVPLLEDQIEVALKNNLLGTKITADLALQYHVERFILISTDKAVNPTNIMGASKRACEIYCHALNQEQTQTKLIVVRFGNVINSAGSVVPLFKKQIQKGGPLTITHPDITRYFMTIPEACRLILQAGSLGEGGEVFVLDMGEPIKIQYLAEQLIQFSGKEVGRDIEIIYTGLRPGEKLFEELFYTHESLSPTAHTKIMRSNQGLAMDDQLEKINTLTHLMDTSSASELLLLLKKLIPEFQS